jgi:hypothetical protein
LERIGGFFVQSAIDSNVQVLEVQSVEFQASCVFFVVVFEDLEWFGCTAKGAILHTLVQQLCN